MEEDVMYVGKLGVSVRGKRLRGATTLSRS